MSNISGHTFLGSQHNDQLSGGAGDDWLHGGTAGRDSLSGRGGDDRLYGLSDHDILDGGEGGDAMIGGAGDDTYIVDDAQDKIYEATTAIRFGSLTVLSTNPQGEVLEGLSFLSDVSADGQKILFSGNSNIAGHQPPNYDFFIKHLSTGMIQKLNVETQGFSRATLSSDGQNLFFQTFGAKNNVYVKNIATGTVQLVSVSINGEQGDLGVALADVSSDGNLVLLRSASTNWFTGVKSDTLYVKNLKTGELIPISQRADGHFGNASSLRGCISPDGTSVVFVSLSSNLDPMVSPTTPRNPYAVGQAFIKNLITGELTALASEGTPPPYMEVITASFSPDGTKVLLTTNIDDDDSKTSTVFVKDLVTGQILKVATSESTALFTTDGQHIITTDHQSIRVTHIYTGHYRTIKITDDRSGIHPVKEINGRLYFSGAANQPTLGDTNSSLDVYSLDINTSSLVDAGGYDTVKSSVSHALPDWVESLELTGSQSIAGKGNRQDNRLTGNPADNHLFGFSGNDDLYGGEGNDFLHGGRGIDVMVGGTGDDIYNVDDVNDVVIEQTGRAINGWDQVQSTVSYQLHSGLESLILQGGDDLTGTGSFINNHIRGNSGANTLIGLAGQDQLLGGSGNDRLFGGLGADWLEGGLGQDYMEGGEGNDQYWVDSATDVVVESWGSHINGWDHVHSHVDYVLGRGLEYLTLVGTDHINATGNALSNRLTGNSARNRLDGRRGYDVLNGGLGADIYIMGRGYQQDRIIEDVRQTAAFEDQVQFLYNVKAEHLWFSQDQNHLVVQIIGTTDQLTVTDWFANQTYRVETFISGDGRVLDQADVQVLVDAMSAMVPPELGQLALSASQQQTLAPIFATYWSLP